MLNLPIQIKLLSQIIEFVTQDYQDLLNPLSVLHQKEKQTRHINKLNINNNYSVLNYMHIIVIFSQRIYLLSHHFWESTKWAHNSWILSIILIPSTLIIWQQLSKISLSCFPTWIMQQYIHIFSSFKKHLYIIILSSALFMWYIALTQIKILMP